MEFRIKAKLITPEDMRRIITRLAHEIVEKNRGVENLAIIGIHTRGAFLAERISRKIKGNLRAIAKHGRERSKRSVPVA